MQFALSPPEQFQQHHKLTAPITARPISLDDITYPMISEQIWGPTVAFNYSGHTLYAPDECRIDVIPERGYEVRLRTGYGLKLFITLSLQPLHLLGEKCERLCRPGETLAKGAPIMRIQPQWLKQKGIELYGALALINGHQVQGLTLSTHKQWLANEDEIMDIYL